MMVIYHYTTISGLIGIISNLELWASDCRYLNDGTELTYANNIFLEEVGKLNREPKDFSQGGGYRIPYSVMHYFRMFVTCFCRNGDLLSQWRGYGVDQGYSLGFYTSKLRALNNGEIIRIQYGISNPSQYFARELEDATHVTDHPGNYDYFASEQFLPRISRIKHPGFAEEQEWRLMLQLSAGEVNMQNEKIKFRPSKMGPISYLALPIKRNCLKEIVIGPGENIKIREEAVQNLLDYYGYEGVKTRNSKIPFRSI